MVLYVSVYCLTLMKVCQETHDDTTLTSGTDHGTSITYNTNTNKNLK